MAKIHQHGRLVRDQPRDYKLIQLASGELAKVSNEDYAWAINMSWHINPRGYAVSGGQKSMHRLVIKMDQPRKSGLVVDHINRDRLDNRRGNLRIVSHQQNTHNSAASKNNKTGYKGVSLHRCGRYIVCIWLGGRNINLGYYETAEEGAWVYDQWALQGYGEHAFTNFEYV